MKLAIQLFRMIGLLHLVGGTVVLGVGLAAGAVLASGLIFVAAIFLACWPYAAAGVLTRWEKHMERVEASIKAT